MKLQLLGTAPLHFCIRFVFWELLKQGPVKVFLISLSTRASHITR